jgi:hypothetical protein
VGTAKKPPPPLPEKHIERLRLRARRALLTGLAMLVTAALLWEVAGALDDAFPPQACLPYAPALLCALLSLPTAFAGVVTILFAAGIGAHVVNRTTPWPHDY